MLYRKNEILLKNWLKSEKKAILLTGARQTGKTFLIRRILESNSQNFVEINFLKSPELLGLLESAKNKDFSAFFTRLQFATRKELTKGKTVIFLDEVQEYKEILTAIKFLVEEGSFRYVLSGSLLGVELSDLRSAPVGYLPTVEMFPMDFEEFLIAQKIPADALARLRENFTAKAPVDEFVHNKILDAFYTYLIVGGMPAAVQEFVDSNDLNAVTRIHKDILKQYNWDFSKYEKERKLHLISTYDLIPSELNSKNKRYMFADLGAKQKFGRYENSFNWLIDAGVAIPTFNTTEPVVPLKINKQNNLFKLFLSDVGLLTTSYGRASQMQLLQGGHDMNCGAIFENAVAQELRTHGYDGYYFNSKKLGELDFVIEYEGKCLPIEVKSGKDYTKHSALNNVLQIENYDIPQAFVFANANVSVRGKITYFPIYMIMFLNEAATPLPKMPRLDLSGLH